MKIWDVQGFHKYWNGLFVDRQARRSREAQGHIDKFHADAGRGAVWGGGIVMAASGYAGAILTSCAEDAIETFDESWKALKLEPDEDDYRKLQGQIEDRIERVWTGVQSHVNSSLGQYGMNSSLTDMSQLKERKLAEVGRVIERRILEVAGQKRTEIPALRDDLFNEISRLNTTSRGRLGFSIFKLSETRVFSEIGRIPSRPEDLATGLQAIGILIDQMDQEAFSREIERTGGKVPDGGLNRLRFVLAFHHVSEHEEPIRCLRDLRRLRDGYPAHPDRPETIEAATRIGINLRDMNPALAWHAALRYLIVALTDLERVLSAPLEGA